MTSGASEATFSMSISLPPTCSGRAPFSACMAQGRVVSSKAPMKSRTPTGTVPSASA
jgi:hypothetical protein